MLIDFSFENFLSFRDETSISLVAAERVPTGGDADTGVNKDIRIPGRDEHLLKLAAIYGANGSGKSNLTEAIIFFKAMVLDSVDDELFLSAYPYCTFQFDTATQKAPSSFEITFFTDGEKYRYGFEVNSERVVSEWLFVLQEGQEEEVECFSREGGKITINTKIYTEDKGLFDKTRADALFLTVCAKWNVKTAIVVRNWIRTRLNVLSGVVDTHIGFTIEECKKNPETLKKMVEFFKALSLGIEDIKFEEVEVAVPNTSGSSRADQTVALARALYNGRSKGQTPAKVEKQTNILTVHKVYDEDEEKGIIELPFHLESVGTKKLFALMGPLFDIMEKGGVAFIDEFGSSIHSHLLIELLKLFQSRLNTHGQLVAITHDTDLLRKDLLDRDQIWFVEKDPEGVSHLYSLLEFVESQNNADRDLREDYLSGIYGAIPYFGNLKRFKEEYINPIKNS